MKKRFLLPYQIAFLLILPLGLLFAMLGGLSLGGPLMGLLVVSILLGLFSYGLARWTKQRLVGDMVGFVLIGVAALVLAYVVLIGTPDTTGWADLGYLVTSIMALFIGMTSRGWMLILEWWMSKKAKPQTSTE